MLLVFISYHMIVLFISSFDYIFDIVFECFIMFYLHKEMYGLMPKVSD